MVDWWKGRVFEKSLSPRLIIHRLNSVGWSQSESNDEENLLPMHLVTRTPQIHTEASDMPHEEVILH